MEKHACTECSYLYRPALGEEDEWIPPGTLFEALPESFACPSCGASKDAFFAILETVNEPFDTEDPSEAELCHIPFYAIENDGIRVRIGDEDSPHPNEGDHFIEWVALFDENGETVDVRYRPDPEEPIFFDTVTEEDFSEIRAYCSLHGVWKGPNGPVSGESE